jgi:hypothetical protein
MGAVTATDATTGRALVSISVATAITTITTAIIITTIGITGITTDCAGVD